MSNLFKKFGAWFSGLFSKIDDWIEDIGTPVVAFVDQIKAAVNSPTAELIVDATAWQWDNELLNFLRANLPKVVELINPNDGVESYIFKLKDSTPAVQDAIYAKTASLLAKEFISIKGQPNVKRFETDTLTQIAYVQFKENNKAVAEAVANDDTADTSAG